MPGYVFFTTEFRCVQGNRHVSGSLLRCPAFTLSDQNAFGATVSSVDQELCVRLQSEGKCRANGPYRDEQEPEPTPSRSGRGFKTLSEDEKQRIQTVLASKCPVCKGLGEVRVGSWWLTNNSDPCDDCEGTGTRERYDTVQARKKG